MKYFITIIILIQLITTTYVNAQRYNFKSISVEEGLPRSGAYSLLQDSKGFLWVTLDGGGVARYDGKSFKKIDIAQGLPSRKVRVIYEDSKNNMWFGTTQGLCKYKNNKLETYNISDGLPHKYIRGISEDDKGNLIVGTNKGLAFLRGNEFETIKNEKDSIFDIKIRTIYTSKHNKTYIGSEEGLFFMDSLKVIKSEINSILPDKTILSIQEDSKGNLWIGTKKGVLVYNKKKTKIYNTDNGLISNRVRAICEDSNNNIWIGTRMGVSCITKEGIININKENGLSHERIRDIMLDDNGTLWFATFYGGINNFNPSDFITFSTRENIISNQILSINQTNENKIIAGTFDGISVFDIKSGKVENIKNYTTSNGLPHNRIYTIYKDKRNFIWLGTDKGIALTKNFKEYINITDSIYDIQNEIYAIVQEDSNTYWIGGEDGLFQITFSNFPKEYIVLQYNNQNIPSKDISSLAIDNKKNIWIGYRHYGLRIKKSEGGGFVNPKIKKDVKNVSTIIIDQEKIWIGTDAKGLFCINNSNLEDSIEAIQYTEKQGLTSNNVYAIAIEDNKNIWIGSEKGLDKLTINNQLKLINIEHFGSDNGIIGAEVLERAIFITKDKKLLTGTVGGLISSSFLNHKQLLGTTKIQLLKLESFDKSREKINNYTNLESDIEIEYSSNNINVEFVGLDLSSPNKVKYKWFLKGYSKKWSEPTSRNYLTFTNLSDKKYELKVKSVGANNIWNSTPLKIKFRIKTPIWKSIWFIIFMVIFFAIIILIFIKWKTKQLVKQKEELESKIKKATEIIKEEKERIEQKNNQISKQKEQLEQQHKEIKQSIDYAQLIQEASLPEKKITDLITDSFLFYQPRDIVSGDFYWWEKKENNILFCVADSTGHGIPGAFISLIGIILSNEIFYSKKLIYPNQILDELNRTIQITLEQHLPNPKIKDGMDLSFCCYNEKNKKLYFSGANNPVWIVRHNNDKLISNNKEIKESYANLNTSSKLYEIKGDKQPIGLHAIKQKPFVLHEIDINKGDEIYLFTDGYADQFGGEKNKKFMTKRFKHILTGNKGFDMSKTKKIVELNFTNWKGKNDQVDDICVVGVRI